LPFATAIALTGLAKIVQAGEQKAIGSVFDRPTPFTLNSVGVTAARKNSPVAVVFVKDVAAKYLEPYEAGGTNKLNSKALLKPVNTTLNQFGNIPRSRLATLKGKTNVFIGKVKGKGGTEVDGVWQRIPPSKGKPASLKLLIRFGDAHPVRQRLNYRQRAEALVAQNFNREMGAALAKAVATAK
jgi:hypothetical protein